jgi:ADP-ribosylglycohydrolase
MTCRSDASFCSIGHRSRLRWGASLAAAAAIVSALAGGSAARAIPEADAIKKLEVIPVFLLTDDKGTPLPIPREKNLILPLYLESAKANDQLAALRKSNPAMKARVPSAFDRMITPPTLKGTRAATSARFTTNSSV